MSQGYIYFIVHRGLFAREYSSELSSCLSRSTAHLQRMIKFSKHVDKHSLFPSSHLQQQIYMVNLEMR